MLVLTRRLGEKIVIGDNIVLTVISVGEKRIKLAITAPLDVKIRRAELPVDYKPKGESNAPEDQ